MVTVREYALPAIDRGEVMRYAGVPQRMSGLEPLLEECLSELEGRFARRVCYLELPVTLAQDAVVIGEISLRSQALAKCLTACERVIVFAATLGTEIDRSIRRYNSASPVRALLLHAIGTERIEALCNAFCADMRDVCSKKGEVLTPRFSPGYGDLSLEAQRALFALLDCPRRIGLSLTESLLMTPSKSVTAIVGVRSNL